MKVGRFIVQVDNYAPIMVKNRKGLIGNKRSMSDKQREQFINQQLEKYYIEPITYSSPSSSPMEDHNPFDESDKSQSVRKEKSKLRSKEQRTGKRSFRDNIVE